MMYERHLEVDISFISDTEAMVELCENETGDSVSYTFTVDKEGEVYLAEKVAGEIWSWLEIMLEEKQAECDTDV